MASEKRKPFEKLWRKGKPAVRPRKKINAREQTIGGPLNEEVAPQGEVR